MQDHCYGIISEYLQTKRGAGIGVSICDMLLCQPRGTVQHVSVDVKVEHLTSGQYKGTVLENRPGQRQRRVHLEDVFPEEYRVQGAGSRLKRQADENIQHGQTQHLPQLARISRGQGAAPAMLDSRGQTGYADIKQQEYKRRDEPEDDAYDQNAGYVQFESRMRKDQAGPCHVEEYDIH